MATNCGACEATAKHLAFLDGDDAFAPRVLDVYEQIIQARGPAQVLRDQLNPQR
jgi:hypothetical protein